MIRYLMGGRVQYALNTRIINHRNQMICLYINLLEVIKIKSNRRHNSLKKNMSELKVEILRVEITNIGLKIRRRKNRKKWNANLPAMQKVEIKFKKKRRIHKEIFSSIMMVKMQSKNSCRIISEQPNTHY